VLKNRTPIGIERAVVALAIETLPDPKPQSDANRASKQDAVMTMLRRPKGATVD
jgi:hypothetical protein